MGKFKSKITYESKEYKRILRDLKKLEKMEVDVGWINGKKYPSNDPAKSRRGVFIASIAFMNEKGHYTINNDGKVVYVPARPYVQQSLHDVSFLPESMSNVLENLFNGIPYRNILNFIGQDMVDNIKKSVAKQNFKALHPKTINIKGKSTQWVDSGRMLDNITYKVTYKRDGVEKPYDKF